MVFGFRLSACLVIDRVDSMVGAAHERSGPWADFLLASSHPLPPLGREWAHVEAEALGTERASW
jgi:hypothetical protein